MLDLDLLSFNKPKSFEGSNSVEVKHDKQFESTCLLIAQKANLDAKNMTVLQFYSTIELIKNQIEAEQKIYNKKK